MFGLRKTNMSNFHPLEVVGRGSETQLLVGENLNYLTYSDVSVKPVGLKAQCWDNVGDGGRH